MGAARRWKQLLPFRSPRPSPAAESKPKPRVADVLAATPSSSPRRAEQEEEEEVPAEFLCPILRAPMADPVILPSGRTYERACVRACADLGLAIRPDGGVVVAGEASGTGGGVMAAGEAIPNEALRAAVRTWCARSGGAPPVPPSAEEAREAVLRAAPPARSVSNLSCSTSRPSAASTSSSSSSSSGGSSREIAEAGEVEIVRVKDAVAANEIEEAEPVDAEEAAAAKAVAAGSEAEVEAAMAALRLATRESEARRRALCTPRLLAALRRVLLSARHTPAARADAAAALANLSLEPENRVPIVRAGAVPALVDALASPSSPPESREHAAGALFGLALHEANRAAVGVLGAVPPLLALLAGAHHAPSPRARRDAGMTLYHLSLAAVNQSKLARAAGGARALLAVAADGAEPAPLRRLALMVARNVAECAEGRAALTDAGAVSAISAVLSDETLINSDLRHWCVAAMYALSRGIARRFRGLARAAGAARPLAAFAEHAAPGVHKEMAETVLRVILDDDGGDLSDREGSSSSASARPPHRRRTASWAAAPPAATPPSAQQWRSVCID